jgi:hypothetical protein
MQRSTLEVKQTVDVWSVGCIFSEVAAWLVHGKDGLEAYREARGYETKQIFDFKDGRAFHDSKDVLQSVGTMHDQVCMHARESDYVTRSVVTKMINEMLQEVDGRLTTKQLWSRAGKILTDARKKLDTPRGAEPESNQLPRGRVPPVRPPESTHSQSDWKVWNGGPRPWGSLKGKEKQRSKTLNVLAQEDPLSPELSADTECDSPDEISNTTQTPPTSPRVPPVENHSQKHRPSAHGTISQPTSPGQQNRFDDLGKESPTPQGRVSRRDSTRYNSRGSDQLPVSGPDKQDLSDNSARPTQAGNPNNPPIGSDPFHYQAAQTTQANSTSAQPVKKRAKRDLPFTELLTAENWVFKRKHYGSTYPPLEHSELLEELKARDHVKLFSP